ncbi:MAG: NAD(P)/FAD-dependent oxidoreductase [Actinomycetota bacterium]|nr:NAD(P)/FAD-dependent oxidoreductase [Actinomycetota bacterium]
MSLSAGRARGRARSGPDAIVVGAGHNGLVAANILADAGWDVLVCEATPHVGGAVRSGEVTAKGYVSDLFSAFYPLAAASPVLAALNLGEHGLTWSHAPTVLSHLFPDGRCATLSRDIDATVASLSDFDSRDGDAWRQLVAEWDTVRGPLLQAVFTPFPPLAPTVKILRAMRVGGTLRFARLAALPVRRLAEERFHGAGAGMLLAGNALHADLSPDSAGSALYGWLLTMLGQTYGFPVPVGGAGELTRALADRLRARGGQIRTTSPVQDILTSGGVATGVRLRGGEIIGARRAVLADVGAPLLYRDLLSDTALPARLKEDLDNFQWDTPTLKVDWALSGPVPWINPAAAGSGTVHLGVDLDGLSVYASDLARRRAPAQPFLLFGQMSTSDASRSPAGTESAWGYTHLPPGAAKDPDLVAQQVDRVEDTIERVAPGFTRSIIGRYVQSPSQLQEENPNLVTGAINGGTAQLHQQLVFRPVPGLGGAATVFDRLYLAGSSAHPGGGVHGAPGANAARAALARDRPTGPLRRRATAAALEHIYR